MHQTGKPNTTFISGRHWRERRDRLRGVQHHLGDRGVRVGGGAGALPELVLGGEGLLLLPHLHHRPPLHHRQRIRLLVRIQRGPSP